MGSADQSTGVVPMSNSVDSFVLWPVGIAFGGWLFFEIAKHVMEIFSLSAPSHRPSGRD
jgi:hypothetical protein